MTNKIKLILNINLLSLVIFTAVFYYFFDFSIYSLGSLILGLVSAFLILDKTDISTIPFIILGIAASLIFSGDIEFTSAFLIGANLSAYYLYNRDDKTSQSKTSSIAVINGILLLSIVFSSSIEKLRGSNKLLQEVDYTIPAVLLVILAIYFLFKFALSINKTPTRKYKNILKGILITILVSSMWGISFVFFKEIGSDRIFLPIGCGIIAAITQTFIKRRSMLTDFNEIVLTLIIPYQIAGLMGISFAFMIGLLLTKIMQEIFEIEISSDRNTSYKIAPLIFLIAASEIRENEGIITRFNLTTGYQLGWLFLAGTIITYGRKYLEKIRAILIDNEVEWSNPLIASAFTILILALIIRFGRDEALAAITITGSLYLFLTNHDSKFVSTVAQLSGSIGFLVLTTI